MLSHIFKFLSKLRKPTAPPAPPASPHSPATRHPSRLGGSPIHLRDSHGRLYRRALTGAITRISPLRPWRGKSERRQAIAARQHHSSY